MNELEQLKARAAELDDPNVTIGVALPGYRELLDRAIAIAEKWGRTCNEANSIIVKQGDELEKARAAAAALRHFIETEFEYEEHDMNQDPVTMVVDVHSDTCSLCQARALLEQHR